MWDEQTFLRELRHTYNSESILNQLNCYTNSKNASSVVVLLTNKQERFLKAKAIETRFCDFHKMVVPSFKTSIKKPKFDIDTYWDLGKASQDTEIRR